MPSDHETTRVRNLLDQELLEYIDVNGTNSPERKHALHVLDDRHQRKNQEKISELTQVIKGASDSSKSLERKLFWLNVILTVATVVGAAATAVTAWQAWYGQTGTQNSISDMV